MRKKANHHPCRVIYSGRQGVYAGSGTMRGHAIRPGKRVMRYRIVETHFPGKPYPSNSEAASRALWDRTTKRGLYQPGIVVEGKAIRKKPSSENR